MYSELLSKITRLRLKEDDEMDRALLIVAERVLTCLYVKHRDGEIHPGYALEKLESAKYNLDSVMEEYREKNCD